jgi:hypothetical protein
VALPVRQNWWSPIIFKLKVADSTVENACRLVAGAQAQEQEHEDAQQKQQKNKTDDR